MCVDTSNCSGTCGECMSDSVRRLTMANKQLTKMCDQYLAELQRARLPAELVERLKEEAEFFGRFPSHHKTMHETLLFDILDAIKDQP